MFGLLQLKHPDVGPNFPLSSWALERQVDPNHGYSQFVTRVPEDYWGQGGGKHGTPKCEGHR